MRIFGISAAAEKLGYTQSTVSSQIKQLESELNTVLFDRFYHRISLTSDGITVLQYAREILESHEKMLEDLRTPETIEGNIRLAMSSSVCNRFSKMIFLSSESIFLIFNLSLSKAVQSRCLICYAKMRLI